jgi:hypothetical protein
VRFGLQNRRLIATIIAAQLVIPTAALVHGIPSRFGFHMYSGHPGVVVKAWDLEGAPVETNWAALVAGARAELDYTAALPEKLCSSVLRAARVEVRSLDKRRVLKCDR